MWGKITFGENIKILISSFQKLIGDIMRGRSRIVTCYFCKKKIPQYKAIMTYKRLFSYRDDRYNVMYFGPVEKIWVCRSCARHRGIVDIRQKMRRNQFKDRPMNNYGYVEHRKKKQENKEIKEENNKEDQNKQEQK